MSQSSRLDRWPRRPAQPLLHDGQRRAGHQSGRAGARTSTAPITTSAAASSSSIAADGGETRPRLPREQLIELAKAVNRTIDDRHHRAQANRHAGRIACQPRRRQAQAPSRVSPPERRRVTNPARRRSGAKPTRPLDGQRPATSLMGASSASRPARRSRFHRPRRNTGRQKPWSVRIGREMQIGEQNLALRSRRHSAGCGSFTLTIISALAKTSPRRMRWRRRRFYRCHRWRRCHRRRPLPPGPCATRDIFANRTGSQPHTYS